jgi:hypothetical protein
VSGSLTWRSARGDVRADFRQLLIGVRPQIGVRAERHRVADNMAMKVLAYLRADVQPAHPEAFEVTTGILAS